MPPSTGWTICSYDPPLEYDTVETSAPTSLALVADITDTPLSELAALNPAVLAGHRPANYSLHVPKGSGNQLMATLQMVPAERRDCVADAQSGGRRNAGGDRRRTMARLPAELWRRTI